MPLLEAVGIKKSYGAHSVLHGVDLAVERGEVITVLGPNGCGKSTFLRCLNWLEIYQEGQVKLRGETVSAGRPEHEPFSGQEKKQALALRRRIGMVFQKFNLFPHLSVLQNVCTGPQHALGLSKGEALAIAEKMLRKVGLWEKHPCAPTTLSGGQQQRVAIARALAVNPEVMLFDEATSALDPLMTQEVLHVVREVAAEGMTMLLVTHDMDFARDAATRVIYMEGGHIAAEGKPDYLFGECTHPGLVKFLKKG